MDKLYCTKCPKQVICEDLDFIIDEFGDIVCFDCYRSGHSYGENGV